MADILQLENEHLKRENARLEALLRNTTLRVRKWEDEANQAFCESKLLRNECMRLREAHGVLAGFVEELPVGMAIPANVMAAMEAVFPDARPAAVHGCDEHRRREAFLKAELDRARETRNIAVRLKLDAQADRDRLGLPRRGVLDEKNIRRIVMAQPDSTGDRSSSSRSGT